MQSPFALKEHQSESRPAKVLTPSHTVHKKLNRGRRTLFLLLALLLLLQHLLDNLLLLDEEGTDDAIADAATTSRAAVGSLDSLLRLGDVGILSGSEGGDLIESCQPLRVHNRDCDGSLLARPAGIVGENT